MPNPKTFWQPRKCPHSPSAPRDERSSSWPKEGSTYSAWDWESHLPHSPSASPRHSAGLAAAWLATPLFAACQMFSSAEHRTIIWLGRVQMGWCSCCDLSELACKHVLTEENCRAMLKSSSWVGFIEPGNPFKCGPMDWEGGSTVINRQMSALPCRKAACLEPLSLSE